MIACLRVFDRVGFFVSGANQSEGKTMGTLELILLIIVLVVLFGGGGGYYWSRRGG